MTACDAEWTQLAWAQLWQVTLLIVVVALTTRLAARNRPYLAHALWLVVLLKCVTPPVFSSAGGVFCWIETASFHRPADVAQAATLPNGDLALKPPAPATAIDVRTPSKNTATPNGQIAVRRAEVARSRQPLPSKIQSQQPAGSRRAWLAGVLIPAWVLGMVAMLGFAAIRLALCWRLVRGRGRRVDPSFDRLMRSLAKRLKLWRPVRLVVTESRVGPAVIGLFRPTVLLPEVVIRGKRPEELEPILAHELLHARRGDLWVGALQMLVQAVWWFHPLVWWATRLTSREAERCCDEAVVAELGCSPARYARCLFDVLKSKRVLRPLPAVPGVRPVEVTSKRMERIMRLGQGSHKRSPLWCWAVMALAAVVALPGAALVMSADEESASPDARSEWLAPAYLSAPGGKDRPEAAPLLGTARLGRLRTGRETAFHDRDPQSHTSRKYAAGHLIRAARSALDLDDVEARQLLRQIVSGEMAWAGLRTALHPERTNEEPSVAWSGDRLLVRASRRQHERIAEALRVMKTHSFSQITVEARWITGPASIIDALEVDWPVSLAEVPAGDPLELPSTTLDPAPGDTSTAPGRALTGREKNLPATFAILDAQQVTALLGRLQELGASEPENTGGLRKAVRRVLGYNDQHNGEVNVLQAPKVTVFNGQKAFINDCSQSPLVVSLNRVVGEDREAFQPIIRVVEVGMRIDLRPELRGERSVWLDCQLELSHIVDVDLSTFVGLGDSLSTLQVPDVETTRVNAAADIPLGKTLLIGGLKTRDSEGNPQSMLVMLSPTNVTPVAAKAAEPVLCQRVYQVADLVVPIPGQVGVSTVPDATARQPAEFEADFDSLIELITSTLSPETWDKVGGAGSVAPVESNWSLVISQTEEVHEGIVDLFEQLRRLQDVQIVLDVELVDLPREIVEKLGIDVGSEEGSPALSSREARLLRALVEESASAGIRRLSKIALFNGQRGDVSVQDQGGRSIDETDKIVLQPVVSDDRRHVRLTIVLNPDGPKGSTLAVSVADGQTLVHEVTDQLSAVIEETRGVAAEPIPGFFRGFRRVRDDAENRQKFLLVTPTVVIREEEEERLGSVTPWRVIIQEEEEEMLGIGPF